MRRSASFILISAFATVALALQLSACVPSSEVPPIGSSIASPTPTPSSAAPPMQASPSALTISKSSYPPGGTSYPSVTVSQPGASTAPTVVNAQSTCITNGNASIYSTASNGNATTTEIQPLVIGQCIFAFGGQGGVTLYVPVTITN